MDWCRKWLVSFDWPNNTDAINMKMDWSVKEKKSTLKMLLVILIDGMFFLSTILDVIGCLSQQFLSSHR